MDEEQFLAAIVADPTNVDQRLVMRDWLEERDPPRAELMRIQEQLRRIDLPRRQELESRMQQLLRNGVHTVVPRMTNSLGMRFAFVSPGEFMMGEVEDQKRVVINEGFWLGETVVTQAQWQSVMDTEPWKHQRNVQHQDDYPATYVSWEDAAKFCSQLSERWSPTSEHYTLPIEAQWEYACRAGTTSEFSFGDDKAELGRHVWFVGNTKNVREPYSHGVGQKAPNPWGLFDMHGNVLEWCQDEDGSRRVSRGGSWRNAAWDCRSSLHYRNFPSDRYDSLGFRVASVPSSQQARN